MLKLMQDKVEALENNENIISAANRLFDIIIQNKDLKDNEKILVVDLLNVMINKKLYKS